MIGPVFPRFCADLSPNLALPTLFRGRVGFSRVSCGTGFERSCLLKAVGEAVERQFSFSEQNRGLKTCRLEELPKAVSSWFCALFGDAGYDDLESWEFQVGTMSVAGCSSSILCPVLPHTLGPSPDDRFMPTRDSSGCALHSEHGSAETAARRELYERQALTSFWYFNHINFACEPGGAGFPSISFDLANLLSILKLMGRVLLFDISLVRPYRVVLAVFLSRSGKVKFSSGAAAASSFNVAAQKALLELYQAYVLMDQIFDSVFMFQYEKEPENSISRHYFGYNNDDIVYKFEEIFESQKSIKAKDEEALNWRIDIGQCFEIIYRRTLDYDSTKSSLVFCSIHLVNGFPTMSPFPTYPTASGMAADFFGLDSMLRDGPVPFG